MVKSPNNESPYQVKKWRDEDVEGVKIEVNQYSKILTPATLGGYLIKGAN